MTGHEDGDSSADPSAQETAHETADETAHETAEQTAEQLVGSATEEALKLLGALTDWARDHGSDVGAGVAGLAGVAAASAREVDEHLATGSAECTYCPVCRTVHAVRQTSPEVRAHLATAAGALLQAAASMLATAVPPDRGGPPGGAASGAGFERIDLEPDEDDPWAGDAGAQRLDQEDP